MGPLHKNAKKGKGGRVGFQYNANKTPQHSYTVVYMRTNQELFIYFLFTVILIINIAMGYETQLYQYFLFCFIINNYIYSLI